MRLKFVGYFFLLLLPCVLVAEGNQQATYILGRVTSFHRANPKIMGDFSLSINGRAQTGVFYYYTSSNSQSVKLFFGPADMDVIGGEKYSYWVVDKNKLWVYLHESKVLVEQEIPEYFRTIGALGAGLSHYFAEYKKFSVQEIEESNDKGEKVSVKKLTFSEPVKEKTAFSSVTLEITDAGFQRSATAVSNTSGKKGGENTFSFRLSNINLNPNFNEKQIFRVVPGGGTQILRNVLMSNS